MYCLYNLESAESCYRRNRKLWVVITIPSVFGLVLLAINTFTNVIFKIDKVNGFVRGKLIGVIYAISIFYIVFAIFYIRRFDKIIEKYKLYIKLRKLYLLMNVVWKILLMRLFFTRLFVSERKQIAFTADEKSHVRISHSIFVTKSLRDEE